MKILYKKYRVYIIASILLLLFGRQFLFCMVNKDADIFGVYESIKSNRVDGLKGFDKRKSPYIYYLNAPERFSVNSSITCEDATIFYVLRMGEVLEKKPYATYSELTGAFSNQPDLASFFQDLRGKFPRVFGKQYDINEVVNKLYPPEIKNKTILWGMGPGSNNFTPIKGQKEDIQDFIQKIISGELSYMLVISQSDTKFAINVGHWTAILVRKTGQDSEELEIVVADAENGRSLGSYYFPICYDIYQKWIIEVADPSKRVSTQSVDDWISMVDFQINLNKEFAENSVKLKYLENTPEIKALWRKFKEENRDEILQRERELVGLQQRLRDHASEIIRKRDMALKQTQQIDQVKRDIESINIRKRQEVERLIQDALIKKIKEDKEYLEQKEFYESARTWPDILPADLAIIQSNLRAIEERIKKEIEKEYQPQVKEINLKFDAMLTGLERRFLDIKSAISDGERELLKLNDTVRQEELDVKKLTEDVASTQSLKKWIIPEIKKLKIDLPAKIKAWETAEAEGREIDDLEKKLYDALKSWYSSVYLVCKIKKAAGDDEFLNGTDHMPFFLPCNPAHVACCKCLKEKIDATPRRIAREYDGVKRSGIYIDACVHPLSEDFIKYINDNYSFHPIYLSYLSAIYHQTLAARNHISPDKKFDAENTLNLLSQIYFTQEQLDQMSQFVKDGIKRQAEFLANKYQEVIYPATIEECHLVSFLSVGKTWETSGHMPYTEADMYLHNSDDIVFETIAYGASLEEILAKKDEVKHLGVKAKLKFLFDALARVHFWSEGEKKSFFEQIELCLWHGMPISKIIPLIRNNRQLLNRLDADLRMDVEPDILKQLQTIGNKARYYRATKNRTEMEVFDKQEDALLSARRFGTLQYIGRKADFADTVVIPVKWEEPLHETVMAISLDQLLKMQQDAIGELLKKYKKEQIDALKQEVEAQEEALRESINLMIGKAPDMKACQAEMKKWLNGDFVQPSDKDRFARLKEELDKLSAKDDELMDLGQELPDDEQIKKEEIEKELDKLRGQKPDSFQEARQKWQAGEFVEAGNKDAYLKLKAKRDKLNFISEKTEQSISTLPQIIGAADKTSEEQVVQLATVDEFVLDQILKDVTRDQLEALSRSAYVVIKQQKDIKAPLEIPGPANSYKINPEFYELDTDGKILDGNIEKFIAFTNAWKIISQISILIQSKLEPKLKEFIPDEEDFAACMLGIDEDRGMFLQKKIVEQKEAARIAEEQQRAERERMAEELRFKSTIESEQPLGELLDFMVKTYDENVEKYKRGEKVIFSSEDLGTTFLKGLEKLYKKALTEKDIAQIQKLFNLFDRIRNRDSIVSAWSSEEQKLSEYIRANINSKWYWINYLYHRMESLESLISVLQRQQAVESPGAKALKSSLFNLKRSLLELKNKMFILHRKLSLLNQELGA
ncbi:MAG: hypothetical protein WCS92_01870 [Candidatus Babeliales bacterium]